MRREWHEKIEAFSDRLNTLIWSLSALFLVAMLALVTVQIFARYLLADAPAWTEEGARYAMIWSGLLGGVVAFYKGADPSLVQISASHSLLRRRAKVWAETICVVSFSAALLMHSIGFIGRAALRETEALGWNLSIVVACIPLYAGLLIVQAALKFVAFELRSRS